MATIVVDEFNDDSARTAGETLTINGATFTQRTDTRWHSRSPASYTGAYNDILPSSTLGGNFVIDATKVRWMPFNGGSGNTPVGTIVTQGSVSGTFLAAYATLSAQPVSAMPASGFIKFREVNGGTFSAGALTGITASATGPDVTGWLEVVMDVAAGTDINIGRLNEFRSSGDWFYLDDTNGQLGQEILVPTNGGGVGTSSPGIWVETGVGTSAYEYYPGLLNAANGWAYQNIGSPGLSGAGQDPRQKFVQTAPNGVLRFGENIISAVSYTSPSLTGTYTWASGTVVVTSTAHGLRIGEQVYLDFTTGSATPYDGVYSITANAANTFSVVLPGAGTAGAVTARARSLITTTTGANTLAIGNVVGVNFTTGGLSAKSGNYMIETVPNTSAFTINTYADLSAVGTGSLVMTIGYVPVSGCHTRVPNIFLRQCATGSRASNATPSSTIANRPEFITSNAGSLWMEYCYGDWYLNLVQPYALHIKNCATFDVIIIQECATALDIDGLNISMYGGFDSIPLTLTSNFAGGTIKNGKFQRGNTPGTNDHAISIATCKNITFENVQSGIIGFVRSSGYSFNIATCNGISLIGCRSINSNLITVLTSQNTTITNLDWCDRYLGYTNATAASYCVSIPAGNVNTKIDGITFGFGGQVINCHPYTGIISIVGTVNTKIRNIGTRSSFISGGTIILYAMGSAIVLGGNNDTVKLQRIYIASQTLRGALFTEANTENNIIRESLFSYQYKTTAGVVTNNTLTPITLNSSYKGIGYALNTTTGQTAIYGTHWADLFVSDNNGRILACMNEPTASTIALNNLTQGPAGGFTSTGALSLPTSGDVYVTESDYSFKGHTALDNVAPVINGTNVAYSSGGIWGNHLIQYQIDTGAGWSQWRDFNATNLSNETVSASGFKLKYSIACNNTNTTNVIQYIRIQTTTTSAAQANNLYDLDVNSITLEGLQPGSEVRAYYGTDPATAIELAGIENSTTTFTFTHSVVGNGYIKIFALGYQPINLPWVYEAEDKEIPIQQVIDRVFNNPT